LRGLSQIANLETGGGVGRRYLRRAEPEDLLSRDRENRLDPGEVIGAGRRIVRMGQAGAVDGDRRFAGSTSPNDEEEQ